MPRTRNEVAQTIVEPLHACERSIDQAIADAAQLIIAMAQGRGNACVAAQVGQDAFAAIGEAQRALMAARGQIVAAHLVLDQVGRDLGMNVRAHGDESEKVGFTGATRRLQVAA